MDPNDVGDPAAPLRASICVVHDVVRRDPSRSVVNTVLRAHVETFLSRYTDEHSGRSLPIYVERELRAAIACGEVWVRRASFGHGGAGLCPGHWSGHEPVGSLPLISAMIPTSATLTHATSSQNACHVRWYQQTSPTPAAPVRFRTW